MASTVSVSKEPSPALQKVNKDEKKPEPEKVTPPTKGVDKKPEVLASPAVIPVAKEVVSDQKPKAVGTVAEPVTATVSEPIAKNVESKPEVKNAGKLDLVVESPVKKEHEKVVDAPVKSPIKVAEKEVEKPKDVKASDKKVAEVVESSPLAAAKSPEKAVAVGQTTHEISVVDAVKDVEPAKKTVEKVAEPVKIEVATEIPQVKTEEKSVEGPSKDKAVESVKIDAVTETPKEKTVPEEPPKSLETTVPPPETQSKTAEVEVISKDIQPVSETDKKDEDSEKQAEKEACKEPEKINETNVEEVKQVNEATPTDVKVSAKDSEEPKTTEVAPKEDVPVKIQKSSNKILKKLKSSLLKAKNVFVGKSKPPTSVEPTKG